MSSDDIVEEGAVTENPVTGGPPPMDTSDAGPVDDIDLSAPAEKPTDEWVTGDEPMTGAQRSYLETLQRDAGIEGEVPAMTKAEASDRIEELQATTGRS